MRKLGKEQHLYLSGKRTHSRKANPQARLEWAYNLGASFPYQQEWIADLSRYKLCVKARQIGMTTAIAIEALIDCILEDEFVILIISPSQRQSDRMMWYIHKAFNRLQHLLGEKIKLITHKRDAMIWPHGSELWSLPNSPTTVMGFDADRVIIDEAGIFPTGEGKQIYEAVMGSLGAKGGSMSLSGMPYGRGKFFFERYEDAIQGKNNFRVFTLPWTRRAAVDAVYKKAVEEQRQYLSDLQFSQTYECAFIDENIVMFPYTLLDMCIDPTIRLISGNVGYGSSFPVFLGVDFAKKIDKTSIVGVIKKDNGIYEVRLIINTKDSYDKQLELIQKINKNLQPQCIFIDESGPGVPMLDFLKTKLGERIKPVPFSAANKERLMLELRNLLADGKLKLPDRRDLIDELHSIEKSVTDLGNIRYLAPHEEGGHADMAFALALAVNQLEKNEFRFELL